MQAVGFNTGTPEHQNTEEMLWVLDCVMRVEVRSDFYSLTCGFCSVLSMELGTEKRVLTLWI